MTAPQIPGRSEGGRAQTSLPVAAPTPRPGAGSTVADLPRSDAMTDLYLAPTAYGAPAVWLANGDFPVFLADERMLHPRLWALITEVLRRG